MTVVSDTSPINYFVLIELQDLLPALLAHVLIHGAVRRELQSPEAPQEIRRWMASRPSWLEFREVTSTPAELQQLDDGEREAIALALTTGTTLSCLTKRKAARLRVSVDYLSQEHSA